MLNLMHRLIITDQIELSVTQGTTHQNRAPLLQLYVPLNDTVAKSPTYKNYWNNLSPDIRNIVDHERFKTVIDIRGLINEEFINGETARLTAGLFGL